MKESSIVLCSIRIYKHLKKKSSAKKYYNSFKMTSHQQNGMGLYCHMNNTHTESHQMFRLKPLSPTDGDYHCLICNVSGITRTNLLKTT